MATTPRELAEAIGQAAESYDLDALEDLERYFTASAEPGPVPFAPAVTLDAQVFGELPPTEAGLDAINLANALDRAKRRLVYRARRAAGYDGPIIVSEGDSWFQYPILLKDVIDWVSDSYAVLSLGGAGHLLRDMFAEDEYTGAIAEEGADFFLISGGGNDMLQAGRLETYVRPYQEGMSVGELIDPEAFGRFRRTLSDTYYRLFDNLTARFPALTILCHGYDYVLPRSEGPWLGPPLTRRGVPERLWPAILAVLIDTFNEELKSLESLFPGRVFHIDCRHLVGSRVNSWNDEIHPKNPGYGRVAARFVERIRAVLQAQEWRAIVAPVMERARPTRRPASTPEVASRLIGRQMRGPIEQTTMDSATEALISARPGPGRRAAPGAPAPVIRPQAVVVDEKAIVAPNAHPCSSLAAWRARLTDEDKEAFDHYMAFIDEPEANEAEQRATRERLRASFDVSFQERILGESNLFQVNFLSRGERAARTVGRISVVNRYGIPMGYGTGFLVAPGLVLTNHHVLDDPAPVAHSYILFDYEYDADNEFRQIERYALTEDIFYTCPALDCTFVSVAPTSERGRSIADYGRLILVRGSGKALRGEPVSILQHADGLPKQIAMRDSAIIGRKDVYIYYTTDTNPGSSGSPVVNDEWFPVALHHRAVPNWNEPCTYVANRGIRISSIFQQLDHDKESDPMAQRVLDLIEPPGGTTSMVVTMPPSAVDEGSEQGLDAARWRRPRGAL